MELTGLIKGFVFLLEIIGPISIVVLIATIAYIYRKEE